MPHYGPSGGFGSLIVVLISVGLFMTYLMATRRHHPRLRPWPIWRTLSFAAGVLVLAGALLPPLSLLARHSFQGHMLHHLMLAMVAPLGLVFAAPITLTLRTLSHGAARRLATLLRSRPLHWLSHPIVALVLNTGGLYLLYLTSLYEAALHNALLHGAVQLHFVAAGTLFTWVVASPDPAPHRPGLRTRLVVLFIAMAAHTTLSKLMYAYHWPRTEHHSIEDIRAGAQLMYYLGDGVSVILIVTIFNQWYRRRQLWRQRFQP